MNLVFVGFKHRHTGEIYHEAMANPDINVLGAWEDTEAGKALADGLGMEFNYETFEDVLNDERVDAICLGGCYGERYRLLQNRFANQFTQKESRFDAGSACGEMRLHQQPPQ